MEAKQQLLGGDQGGEIVPLERVIDLANDSERLSKLTEQWEGGVAIHLNTRNFPEGTVGSTSNASSKRGSILNKIDRGSKLDSKLTKSSGQ